ncbi:calcium-activated chloride channel regulator 4A-like [Glandiceps talaboti]
MTVKFFVFLFAVILSTSDVLGLQRRARIKLENNGFIGPLIAINEDVPEDRTIIDRLIDVFTDASSYLHTASRYHTYLSNVTILIPKSWSDDPSYLPAIWETYDLANVIVDDPSQAYWHSPYSQQALPCGQGAEYIHLTPRWITDEDFSVYYWGPQGKVIVHEWGHLRWGLFDEYAITDDEHFYFDENGHTQPTRCSEEITGRCLDIYNNYKKCNKKPENGLMPEPGCMFFPDLNDNPGKGSYLFANYVDSVSDFCHNEEDGDPTTKHNRLANNMQNKLCNHRSSWEMMLMHPDFTTTNPIHGIDTTPHFNIIKAQPRRVVLVMDVSLSMLLNDRLKLLVQAATSYIRHIIPEDSWIGLVEFSTYSNITYPLTQVTSDEVREQVIASLPTTPYGETCIGCGLLTGIQVLENGMHNTNGGILFLVSDGQENTPPLIDEVIDDLTAAQVTIDSMSFSDEADVKLTALSQDFGGLSYYFSESTDSTALHDGFTSTVVDRDISDSATPIPVASVLEKVRKQNQKKNNVYIDDTLGNNTKFLFYSRRFNQAQDAITVELSSPSGVIYDDKFTGYMFEVKTLTTTIEIPGLAEYGRWSYTIMNSDSEDHYVEVAVHSVASDSALGAMRLSSWVGDPIITESPPKTVIYAELRRAHTPIIDANVLAIIDRPGNNELTTLTLLDNGAGADIIKDDGIYSAYFLEYVNTDDCDNNPCRYSISVTADDIDGNARITTFTTASGALPINNTVLPVDKEDPISVGNFDRTATGGVIQLADDVIVGDPADSLDVFPPSRITDLADITDVNSTYSGHVTLTWTASGDDFDQGTASYYDLRYDTAFSAVFDNFDEATRVKEGDVIDGSLLSPQPAGSREEITVSIPIPTTTNMTYYFAVVAVDDADNHSNKSNIASVSATIVYLGEEYMLPGLEAWAIVLITLTCVAAVGATVAIAIYILKIHKNKKVAPNDEKPDVEKTAPQAEGADVTRQT